MFYRDLVHRHLGKLVRVVLGTPLVAYFALDLPQVRRERLKYRFSTGVNFDTGDLPYVPSLALVEDLRMDLVDQLEGGVRILWGVSVAGKTTTVKRVVEDLFAEGKIGGCIYLTAPTITHGGFSVYKWFMGGFSDWFGPLLKAGDKFSTLLGYDCKKPYVIVIDQVEGAHLAGAAFEHCIRFLAYDSADCKAFNVVLITSDPEKAADAFMWNGGTKITLLGESRPWEYRWTSKTVEVWIEYYLLSLPADDQLRSVLERGSVSRVKLVNWATEAGTPACLIRGIELMKRNQWKLLDDPCAGIAAQQWASGQQVLGQVHERTQSKLKSSAAECMQA